MDNQTNNSNLLNGQCFISNTQRSITIPILLIFAIPSLPFFLFIFYHLIKLRKRLIFDSINHHVILLILISDFLLIATELPMTLEYLFLGHARSSKICIFWVYWDYILETASLFLTMYASIERYLLVFHKQQIQKYKLIFHYIPMSCAGLYIPILYFYLVILAPCVQSQHFDTTAFACGGACFFSYVSVNTYDTVADTMLPCILLLIFNLLIILRVVIIKRKAASSSSMVDILSKNRRMILQLLGISLMSLIAWMPWVVIIIAQNFFDPSFGNWFITYILHYLPYLTTSASPFLALIGLPEIRKHLTTKKYQTKSVTKPTSAIVLQPSMPLVIQTNDLMENTHH